ncbi:winged helix-turn-helix domain-containing protein [Microlunatus elymi]|nr:winged helix-turn-helix domain-containing protein [Microlunatus elymi]
MASANSTRYGHVVATLSAQIRSGRFNVGDELPTVTNLAEEFQVSHMTVKQALRTLREQGIVSTGRGTRSRVLAVPTPDEEPLTEQLRAIRNRLDSLERGTSDLASRTSDLEHHASKASRDDPAEP